MLERRAPAKVTERSLRVGTSMKSSIVLLNSSGSSLRASLKYCTNSFASTVPFWSCRTTIWLQARFEADGMSIRENQSTCQRATSAVDHLVEFQNHSLVFFLGPGTFLLSELSPRLQNGNDVGRLISPIKHPPTLPSSSSSVVSITPESLRSNSAKTWLFDHARSSEFITQQ